MKATKRQRRAPARYAMTLCVPPSEPECRAARQARRRPELCRVVIDFADARRLFRGGAGGRFQKGYKLNGIRHRWSEGGLASVTAADGTTDYGAGSQIISTIASCLGAQAHRRRRRVEPDGGMRFVLKCM